MPSAFPLPARLPNSFFPFPLTKPAFLREDCAITVELLAAVVSTFSVDSGTFATVSAMGSFATVAATGFSAAVTATGFSAAVAAAETFAASAATGTAFFFDSKIIMQLRSYLQQT